METKLPVDGHVLVVDDSQKDLRSISRQLQQGMDPHIKVVLLDYGVGHEQVVDFVAELKLVRSDVIIVGSSSTDCRREFAAAGVNRFLLKPWRIADLVEILLTPSEPCNSEGSDEPTQVGLEIGEAADAKTGGTRLGKDHSDSTSLRFSRGDRVSISVGSMTGWKGTVVSQRTGGKILLQIQAGILVEIHEHWIEAVPRAPD